MFESRFLLVVVKLGDPVLAGCALHFVLDFAIAEDAFRRDELSPSEAFNRTLLLEDLHHKLLLNLIELLQRCVQSPPIFIRSFAKDILEAKGGAPHEHFCIF